jgi:hypothetical protein
MSMTAIRDSFITKVRTSPQFVEAASSDTIWQEHLAALERGLDWLDRVDTPELIDIADRIQAAITSGAPIKQRLLAVMKLLAEARDMGRTVN